MVGVDKDLAAHFMIINNRGRCLFGTPILKLFGEVEDKYYFDIIVNDIVNAREEISYNTMYLILNLIRVLVYKIDKSIYSKLEVGEWGLTNLPKEYNLLIKKALLEYKSNENPDYDIKVAINFADYILKNILEK